MERELAVIVSQLTDDQKTQIKKAADAHGFALSFFPDAASAAPHLQHTEVILSSSAEPAGCAPALKWFCATSAGVDAFTKPGVFASPFAMLTNSSGAYGVTIAEHIIMVTLEMMRKRTEYLKVTAQRRWERDLPIHAIHGSRVTLLGTGNIGQEAALRLRAFSPASLTGVNLRGANPGNLFDRIRTVDQLDTVLPETDLLIMSLPGTAKSAGLLGEKQLALLPNGAFLVNVGRGSAVCESALEAELRSGRLGGAALDVIETEPLPAESSLWDCPGLLITPHCSGNMTLPWTVRRIVELFLEDFENYCSGRPLLRRVNLEAGY